MSGVGYQVTEVINNRGVIDPIVEKIKREVASWDGVCVSPHRYGGIEFRVHRWIALSVDAQYTHIPGILGVGGISKDAGESDLGGVSGRFKLIVGR